MSNEKTLKKHSIKDDFSMMAILTIPVCVAVNFVGGQLASLLKLPMYLDVIGTIFSGMLCGPWVAAVVGAITNLLTSIANPVNLFYSKILRRYGFAFLMIKYSQIYASKM